MKPAGQLQYFRSNVDGKLHPCAVCATDTGNDPKPLLLEVSPGAISNLPAAVALTEEIAGIAARHGQPCVVLRPTGRGPGSVYQNYGEVDVLEAIEHVAEHYAIDRDRIAITGSSMGGAATWYLASHYPDLFAAAAPFCGYCDYRLWEKPGGLTFHMHEWEKPSWEARSAAFLVENLMHTPVWMVHGEWDRAVGGGVPATHSHQMARLMNRIGAPHRYTVVPKTGHGCRAPEIWEEIVLWLLSQRKPRSPNRVCHATYDLRHNRSHWVTVDQLARYGDRGLVVAAFATDGNLTVRTENVRMLSFGPAGNRVEAAVTVDGQDLGKLDLSQQQTCRRSDDGRWESASGDLSREKRRGASGPIGDLFFDGAVLVPGTTGSDEETFFANWIAGEAHWYYRNRNGGVHRGGIMGENHVDLPVVKDTDLTDDDLAANNLILYGTPATNAVLSRLADQLPIAFDGKSIHLSDKTYTANCAAAFAVFPHPLNPDRAVAVHGGVTPDAICFGSHLDMNLLPDYLVYARGELLDWGFWGNDWRSQK